MKLSNINIFLIAGPQTTPSGSLPPLCLTLLTARIHMMAAPCSPLIVRSIAGGTMFIPSSLSSS